MCRYPEAGCPMKCKHCDKDCGVETLTIARKWVSMGKGPPYDPPVVVPCCKSCKELYLQARARYFAVLDETMNTHRDFVRVNGQSGYIDLPGGRLECKGWLSASEVGVEYVPSERYKDYY